MILASQESKSAVIPSPGSAAATAITRLIYKVFSNTSPHFKYPAQSPSGEAAKGKNQLLSGLKLGFSLSNLDR